VLLSSFTICFTIICRTIICRRTGPHASRTILATALAFAFALAPFALALAFAAFAFHLALAAHVLALARDNNVCYMQRPAIANSNCPNDKRGSGAELNSNGTFSQHGLITVGVRSTVKSFRSVSACVPTVRTLIVFLPSTGYQQLGYASLGKSRQVG